MKPNEFVGFTLPVVNEGPWSYFSNGNPENGEDGEEETMIVNGSFAEGVITIDETSKNIYDAIASGKTVYIKFVDELLGTSYSLITDTLFNNASYIFYYTLDGQSHYVSGAADENPSYSGNEDIG